MNTTQLGVYDLVVLYEHFSKKPQPSEEDKDRMEKINKYLGQLADSILDESTYRKMKDQGLVS
jgi:hypothetical protein